MTNVATIRAKDLSLLLGAVKLRKYTSGRTCQLCTLSEAPIISVECRYRDIERRHAEAAARRFGISPARVTPMQRGEIVRVIERTQVEHGRREVLRTWGTGIRVLLQEPRYVLNGGSTS